MICDVKLATIKATIWETLNSTKCERELYMRWTKGCKADVLRELMGVREDFWRSA